MQRDPIGYAGGLNLYGYVGSMPTFYTDPLGLSGDGSGGSGGAGGGAPTPDGPPNVGPNVGTDGDGGDLCGFPAPPGGFELDWEVLDEIDRVSRLVATLSYLRIMSPLTWNWMLETMYQNLLNYLRGLMQWYAAYRDYTLSGRLDPADFPLPDYGVLGAYLDVLQNGLDIAGMVPLFGSPADLVNSAISFGRGNYVEAGLSAVGAIPFGELVKGAAKIAGMASYADEAAALAKQADEAMEVGGDAGSKIQKVGGRNPINSKYAGEMHPAGVKFKETGFPDFAPWATAEAKLDGLTGKYATDAAMANAAVGLKSTPVGYVWHHVEDGKTMILIPQNIHNAVKHTGGAAVIRHRGDP